MKKLKFDTHGLTAGFLYFYIHFMTETVCFFMLGRYQVSVPKIWLIYLTYNMLAFVPQAVIGRLSDKHRGIPFGVIGLGLLASAVLLEQFIRLPFLSLTVLCLGNACTHVEGAEITLRVSNGKLSHSAIFVAGGSFGVITGKLLGASSFPAFALLFPIASAVPFALLARTYLPEKDKNTVPCASFRICRDDISGYPAVLMLVAVVAVRGFMAYGIPTSWNKSTAQTVALFICMGTGKAAGGVLADMFGARKTVLVSAAAALPFLLFGDRNMAVSLTGVLLFSMTMSITLGGLVSVLPAAPGLAFGLTTTGLFLGCLPVFFFRVKSLVINCVMLTVLTALCLVCLHLTVDDRKKRRPFTPDND